MPKKKKSRRRQGLFSKAINAALIALGFARPIQLFMEKGVGAVDFIISEATFGLTDASGFNLQKGLRMYAPVGAAVGLGKLKSYLFRHFPVR